MSTVKRKNKRKKLSMKQRKSIQNLFETLRNESSFTDSSLNNTVICLDDSINSNAGDESNKRKGSDTEIGQQSKKLKREDSVIFIKEELVTNNELCSRTTPIKKSNSQIQSSTPNANIKNKSIQSLNISRVIDNNEELTKEIENLTKVINEDSFVTIDLTKDSNLSKTVNTVIDLDNSCDTNDCTLVSISNANLSMSGDSDVTLLNCPVSKKKNRMQKFIRGIAKMNASEKGRLLELITHKILKDSDDISDIVKISHSKTQNATAEDTYIKTVILNPTQSKNSIGSNIYNPERDIKSKSGLRMVVIDGSNVAMGHSQGRIFSVEGLKICIDYFLKRGHIVKAFVPRFRCKYGKSSNPRLLDSLERQGHVVYTPSREVQGRTITPYDDRYIIQCAAEFDGVIVSGDNYRDLMHENPKWKFIIENRLLMFTWVSDMIMFPKDPLGRFGPTLEKFLKHT